MFRKLEVDEEVKSFLKKQRNAVFKIIESMYSE